MILTIYAAVSVVVHVCVLSGALLVGSRSERWGALLLAASMFAVILVQDRRFVAADINIAYVDAAQAFGFLVLARVANKPWVIFACALTLFGVAVHAAQWLVNDRVSPVPYLNLYAGISYAVLGCLCYGTAKAWRQKRLNGGVSADATEEASTIATCNHANLGQNLS